MDAGEMEEMLFENRRMMLAVARAWKDAAREYPEWADHEFESPSVAGTGIGLELYGRVVGYYLEDAMEPDMERVEAINQTVVRAVESTLALKFPESKLLSDVKGWMAAEAEEFSPEVRRIIGAE